MRWKENYGKLGYKPVHGKVKKGLIRNPAEVLYDIEQASADWGVGWEDYHTSNQSQHTLEFWRDIPAHNDLIERVDKWVVKFNESTFKLRINCFQHARLTRYTAAAFGHHGWHSDYSGPLPNKLAYVLMLEQADKGGDLHLFNFNDDKPIPLEPGDLIVFPAYHPHRVTRITKGRHTVMTGWYGGPPLQ
jgi:hypothetical protein